MGFRSLKDQSADVEGQCPVEWRPRPGEPAGEAERAGGQVQGTHIGESGREQDCRNRGGRGPGLVPGHCLFPGVPGPARGARFKTLVTIPTEIATDVLDRITNR